MATITTRDCASNDCDLRSEAGQCGLANGVPPAALVRLARELCSPGGHPAAAACALWRAVLQPRMHRLRFRDDPGELEDLADFLLLTERVRRSRGERPVDIGYLVRVVEHHAVDQRRELLGRMRCNNCRSFLPSLGTCSLLPGPAPSRPAPELPPAAAGPGICGQFSSLRATESLAPEVERGTAAPCEESAELRLHRALGRLAHMDPGGAELVTRIYLEERSLRSLAQARSHAPRRLRRRLGQALRNLGSLLEDQP